MSATPVFAVLFLMLVVLLGFGGLLATLLAGKSTRKWGIGLGVGAAALVVGGGFLAVMAWAVTAAVQPTVRPVAAVQTAVQTVEGNHGHNLIGAPDPISVRSDFSWLQFVGFLLVAISSFGTFFHKRFLGKRYPWLFAGVVFVLFGGYAILARSAREQALATQAEIRTTQEAIRTAEVFRQLTEPRISLEPEEKKTLDFKFQQRADELATSPAAVLKPSYLGVTETRSSRYTTASDGTYSVTLAIEDAPPAWGGKPLSDDEIKTLAHQRGVDYIFRYKSSPQTSLRSCLDWEKPNVLGGAKHYVAIRSNNTVSSNLLGMSTPEIYERFVLERRLVQYGDPRTGGGPYTLHTLVGFKNKNDGDALVQQTIARVRDARMNAVATTGCVVLLIVAAAYGVLKLGDLKHSPPAREQPARKQPAHGGAV